MLTIRGHHLFDMLDALATGKSDHKTLAPVAQHIRSHPKTAVKVVIGVDDICSPCEWWDHNRGYCTRNVDEHPQDDGNSGSSDRNAVAALGLSPGDVMNANELYQLIRAKVDERVFAERVCVDCRLVDRCRAHYEERIEDVVRVLTGCK